jgi:hypothetical protein
VYSFIFLESTDDEPLMGDIDKRNDFKISLSDPVCASADVSWNYRNEVELLLRGASFLCVHNSPKS